jgi:membrane fusion protein, copper/silver efflux system
MKKIKVLKIFTVKWVNYGLLLVLGIFLGWLFFHSSDKKSEIHNHQTETARGTTWTCAMHPQIRMQEPGKCPICGMDLIPVTQSGSPQLDPDAIHLSKEAAELANVLTNRVSRQSPVKELRLYGKVQADERLLQSQVSHIPGRIEKLYVNFTGESVRKGQKLAEIYSPELVSAQQELIETAKTKQLQPELYEAAKEKLKQWKLTDEQIAAIEGSGSPLRNFEILANTDGVVTSRRVNTGDYISTGSVLFDITDLSNVWVLFDAYESDLPFLTVGQNVKFSMQAVPGKEFSGRIVFIDPVIDPVTRVAKIRVEAGNSNFKLKPEMFATGIAVSDMKDYHNKIVIPKSSVLWTGKRSVVYVREPGSDEPVFKLREIGLGPVLGDSYVVTDGLEEGEEIVTQGTFSVDAAAQLEGKPSMMNSTGGQKTNSMPGMKMPGEGNIHDTISAGKNVSDHNQMSKTKIEVGKDFTVQLNKVYDSYIVLKDAFVMGDMGKAKSAALNLQQALSGVDTKLLNGDAHKLWIESLTKLGKQTAMIISSAEIEDQRKDFSDLSSQLYSTIKSFGLPGKTTYYQFCPMAFDNKGAYWLSESQTIRNPYFGEKMMNCGSTKETLNY